MKKGRIIYTIQNVNEIPNGIKRVVSYVTSKGYIIMGRYGTNKTKLKKILRAYCGEL